jgi:hypothetical protein
LEADLSVIDRLHELNSAVQIKELCDEIMYRGGTKKMERVASLADTWREMHVKGGFDDPLAEYDLADVFTSLSRTGGLSWRLPELNISVGPVCQGDLVLVGKRPEVGGTTFLTSEFTHMLAQLPEGGNAIIFNNEESRAHVQGRAMQSALNWTSPQLLTCPASSTGEWHKFLGTRSLDIIHNTNMTTTFCEHILKRKEYGLIGFNVLWKVRPWGKNLEDFQAYQRVAQWARIMADRYAPVVAIWQADASAEGVEWMDQSQLYGSKTGVQGEADVQIMIGKTNDLGKQLERYISVVKNKLPGGAGTKPEHRHGRFVVDMDAERGRFKGRMK